MLLKKDFKRAALPLLALSLAWVISGCSTAIPVYKTYQNPLITDHHHGIADPDVLEDNGKYYLYPTTDGRGYEVFVSEDLVHWKKEARVLESQRGSWAPDLFRYDRNGKYYLYYTADAPDSVQGNRRKQIGVAVSSSPLGPFEDKGALANESIDAHLFQDDDGKLYLYYVELKGGFKIFAQPMSDPLTKTGERVKVIHPTEQWEMMSGRVTEGPFMLKRGDTYYLMFSGSGADSQYYGIGYATSKSPLGPFTKYAGNPIAQRGGNVFGPGHHCVVTGPDGKLWMLYHQKRDDKLNWARFLALDPIWFDEQGVLHARVSRDTNEPAPAVK